MFDLSGIIGWLYQGGVGERRCCVLATFEWMARDELWLAVGSGRGGKREEGGGV